MTKKFLKDNRGQMLYAVLVAVIFLSMLAMLAMGLTLQNYHAAQQKQQHVSDYYAADAAAEMLRIDDSVTDADVAAIETEWKVEITPPAAGKAYYEITGGTVTIKATIENQNFTSWEVRYHAVETEQADADQAS